MVVGGKRDRYRLKAERLYFAAATVAGMANAGSGPSRTYASSRSSRKSRVTQVLRERLADEAQIRLRYPNQRPICISVSYMREARRK